MDLEVNRMQYQSFHFQPGYSELSSNMLIIESDKINVFHQEIREENDLKLIMI